MEVKGVVEMVRGALAQVRVQDSACGRGCCRTTEEDRRIWARNLAGARPGEHVRVQLAEAELRRAMLAAFGWPMLAWFAVALLLMRWGALAAWVGGMAAAVLVWRWAGRRARFLPVISAREGEAS